MPKAGDCLSREAVQYNFRAIDPPLGDDEAAAAAARCLYCYDAPCTRACPTRIDVPKFIRQIMHRDALGAARTILDANILGGSCARACPTEVLCEGACVDNTLLNEPVLIGRLQRYACDEASERHVRFYEKGEATGKRVAVIGAGPAGLCCAHELCKQGHDVVVFEARDEAGGLNTFGIAAYKISTEFARSEVALVAEAGMEIRLNSRIDGGGVLEMLDAYDAVFLGVGLGRTAPLGIDGEDLPGVWEALDFIEQTHRGPLEDCEIGRDVLVIGGGNTAIDVATAAVRLGASSVTIAYRRNEAVMPAFRYEYALARRDGIRFEWLAQPLLILEDGGHACGVEFARTRLSDPESRAGRIEVVADENFALRADMIVKALGQEPLLDLIAALPDLRHHNGRIVVDPGSGATGVARLYAGGDCISGGAEIVDAVQHGKLAAAAIHAAIRT